MNKKIIIYSNFNTPNYMGSPYLEESSKKIHLESWINNRMDIFFDYTLKGFKGQSNQNFTAVYNYHDPTENLILNAIKSHGGLPNNVLFVPRSTYEETIDNLVEGYDQLYLTKLDSDDVYIKSFIEKLHSYTPKKETEVIISDYGYMYDILNNRMAKIRHVSASFHSYIYKLKEEKIPYYSLDLSPIDLLDESHFSALKHTYEYIEGFNYLWNIHGENSSTRFANYNSAFLKTLEMIDNKKEIQDILDLFL